MQLLLECSIRVALIAAAVAATLGALRIAGAHARHRAWCVVMASMLLLPAFSLWGPKLTLRILPSIPTEAPAVEPWVLAMPPEQPETAVLSATPAPNPRHDWNVADVLVAVYLLGAGASLLRLLAGSARAAALRGRATSETGFASSSECTCPITVGWLRPAVILPAAWREWPRAELDAVLAHEREHARRRDPLVQWLAGLNRCVFWFHPLAWWLERRLSALAEEACDAAALARGHDPRDYSEYLLHQARAIRLAGSRVALQGVAMGQGALPERIRRLLDGQPAPRLSRPRALAGVALCAATVVVGGGCQLGRAEKAAPGQPTMNELMHRRAAANQEWQAKEKARMDRAHAMTPEDAQTLAAKLKDNPQDEDSYWTLVRHYEFKGNLKALDALRLWYIEHQPDVKRGPGNIDPKLDRPAYDRGKALWLANLKRPGAAPEIFQRAADFLEGDDRPLAESALEAGQKAYPEDKRWAMAFGRHYAQALLGSGEPVTEFNVFRVSSAKEAQSSYAESVRARLAESKDARVLAQTAQSLLAWGSRQKDAGVDSLQLARAYAERALSLDPNSEPARGTKWRIEELERSRNPEDKMYFGLNQMRNSGYKSSDEAEPKARELLKLAEKNRGDAAYGDAVFEAHIILGKTALRRGDKKTAARELLAATETPGSDRIRRGEFEMNLPRALVDWGERSTVAEFYERMAAKTTRSKQFQNWAADIRKGVNPDLIPTFSSPTCSKDPC